MNYIEETEIEAVPYYYIRHDIAMSEFTSELMAESYGAIGEHLAEDMQNMTGPPFNLTEEWNRETQRTIFRVAIPANSSKGETDRIKKDMRYGGRVVMAEYQGPYEGIEPAYMGLEEYVEANGLETAGYPFEVYITDPGMEADPSKWITEVYWPVQ